MSALGKRLDRDVYQIVRRFEDADRHGKTTAASVYEGIRRSNSSLARLKRRVLEDSIDRVLKVRQDELRAAGAGDNDDDADSDALVEAAEREREEKGKGPRSREQDASWLNRQIAKSWNFNADAPGCRSKGGAEGDDDDVGGGSGGGSGGGGGGNGRAGEPASSTVNSNGRGEEETGASATPTTTTAAAAAVADGRQANGEPSQKKRRRGASSARGSEREDRPLHEKGMGSAADRLPPTGVSIRDIAGADQVLARLLDEVWFPLRAGDACARMGFRYDNCVLLHGPSGCGKTVLAHAVAGSVGVAFIPVSAPAVVSGISGESERQIREVFDEAVRLAPCLVFLDEIDAIAGPREGATKGMEGRIVASIMAGMDRITRETPLGRNVVVLAATNRPDALDHAVRRRFSTEIDMGVPDEDARDKILRSMMRGLNLADDVDFRQLAKLTPGYVGSDLQHVVKAAVSECSRSSMKWALDQARLAQASSISSCPLLGASGGVADEEDPNMTIDMSRQDAVDTARDTTTTNHNSNSDILDKATTPAQRDWLLLESCHQTSWPDTRITAAHLRTAVSRVQPASRREGFSTIPDTTWQDVGALADVRRRLEMAIIGPIRQPERFRRVGIQAAAGILLWGPPGCGKTLVAKAVANESSANFISIKGPELLNKYVGESERAVRQVFSRARSSIPCILFFDEIDALVPRRDDSLSDASARVVNALLTELDGVGDRSGIYVIGATNRPDIIDPAIRRPGRLGTAIFVGLPAPRDRVDILRTLWRNTVPAADAAAARPEPDLEAVALDPRCEGFSGADLGSLLQAAAQACLERTYPAQQETGGALEDPVIGSEDWEKALAEVKPSVKDPEKYGLAE